MASGIMVPIFAWHLCASVTSSARRTPPERVPRRVSIILRVGALAVVTALGASAVILLGIENAPVLAGVHTRKRDHDHCEAAMIRIVLADDQAMFRRALARYQHMTGRGLHLGTQPPHPQRARNPPCQCRRSTGQ